MAGDYLWGIKGLTMNKRTFLLAAAAASIVVAGTSSSFALDRRVRIINDSIYDIHEFYASSVGAKTWEEDILGRQILPSGTDVVINIDDGTGYCKYDFRAVFEDGEEVITESVNVCEISSFTYHD
jgi:hypothetical protein